MGQFYESIEVILNFHNFAAASKLQRSYMRHKQVILHRGAGQREKKIIFCKKISALWKGKTPLVFFNPSTCHALPQFSNGAKWRIAEKSEERYSEEKESFSGFTSCRKNSGFTLCKNKSSLISQRRYSKLKIMLHESKAVKSKMMIIKDNDLHAAFWSILCSSNLFHIACCVSCVRCAELQ